MVVENLVQKEGTYEFPQFAYESKTTYRYTTDFPRVFHSRYEYWYDGRLFLIGSFNEKDLIMVDAETGVFAVHSQDFQRNPTIKMLLDKFKEKIFKSGKSIHEVVRNFKSNNLDLELWLVNSLII